MTLATLLRRPIGAALKFRQFRREFAAFAALNRAGDGRFALRWEDRLALPLRPHGGYDL